MPSPVPDPGPGAARRPGRRAAVVALLATILVAGGVLLLVAPWSSEPARQGRTVLVDIPRGTGARIDRGERVNVIPQRLVAHAGDTLRVVNRDSRDHTVGPFFVSAGQTMETSLATPGTYTGACSLHPSSKLEIVVLPPGAASPGSAEDVTDTQGRRLFLSVGCSSCHTLAAAGATGQVGPNLDRVQPSAAQVTQKLLHGGGGMPSFAGSLTAAQVKELAAYVSGAAGR